ncbi:MAG TPA: TIM barrel protein [Vicinamibacterales bacterium]|nr:TIM barrel protein [Vicinamibacterales bacterium]
MMITRREFGSLALAPLAVALDDRVNGVRVGVQTYSFRDLPRPEGGGLVDGAIAAMNTCGLADCELWAEGVEPKLSREALRRWRVETPIGHFRDVGAKFKNAGITIYAYNYSPGASYTDEEIDRGFDMAKALGAQIITSSTTIAVAKRIVPFAEKHMMVVALHGHSNIKDPNQFATPQSFAAAMQMSKYFKINLDIGHFTAAGFEAVPFIREHHGDITNLHIKDMKRNVPDSYVPWGTGDAPIRDVLLMLKNERWPIRAHIEYEYAGKGTPIDETKRCFDYVKTALA